MSFLRMPGRLDTAWHGTSPRDRSLLRVGLVLIVLAVAYALAYAPLTHDIERTREALMRDRATLAALQRHPMPAAGHAAALPVASDPRTSIDQALQARGLRHAATQVDVREGRATLVMEAVPFQAVVQLVDDLSRNVRLRLVEARVTARVEPGTVRAELTFAP